MNEASATSATNETAQAPTAPAIQIPRIGTVGPDGAIYAGIARGVNGAPDYHLVLLADKPAKPLSWQDGMAWAAGLGASLPTRDESALLYAFLRDQFEWGWHWTGTQYSSSNAWLQYFYDGGQHGSGKKAEGRCRAVRRFNAQSFNPLEA